MTFPFPQERGISANDSTVPEAAQSVYERALYIEAEQVKLLYGQAPTSLTVTLINAVILALVLKDVVALSVLLVWLSLIFAVTLGRIYLVAAYHRAAPGIEATDRWRRRFILGAGCAGMAWGSAGILLFDHDSLVHQIFLAFVLGGMITGAAAVLSWVKEAFVVFLVPTALPIVVQFFLHGGDIFLAMGALSAVFTAALLTVSHRLHASVMESLSLRFDKTNLIRNLSFSESQTAAVNIALREEVAERRRAEDALRVARDELEERVERRTAELLEAKETAESADRAKGEFLATMSHELRTPLNIIMGYADLMGERVFGPLSAEQAGILKRVKRNAQELYELITAMLDLSRLEAGRLPVDTKEVPLSALFAEIQDETREVQEQSPLQFVWRVEEHLPLLRTDPGKLKIIVKNLLSNAIRFTSEGSITVSASAHGDGVEICVQDTGIGIPPEALSLIFEPFQQVRSAASPQLGGTGLGLHIVKRLLGLLGGQVTVESEEGRGSIFRIWVPVNAPRAKARG